MEHPKHQLDDEGRLWLGVPDYGHEIEVAAFSGDGTRVLTVREVDVARIWEVDTGRLVQEIRPTSPLCEPETGRGDHHDRDPSTTYGSPVLFSYAPA